MKKPKLFFIIFFVLFPGMLTYAQKNMDSVLVSLKQYDFNKAEKFVQGIKNNKIRELLSDRIYYYQKGKSSDIDHENILDGVSGKREKALVHLLIADYHHFKKDAKKNGSVFKEYSEAIIIGKDIKDTFLICEALRKMNLHILYRARDTLSSKFYLDDYGKFSGFSALDRFWHTYLSIGYEFMITEDNVNTADLPKIESLFKTAFSLSEKNSPLEGRLYQMQGVYFSHWLKDYRAANNNNLKAYTIYKKQPFWFFRNKLKGLEYNTNVNYYKNKEFSRAIPFFKKDLKRNKEPLLVMHTNEWLFKSYEGLKKYDSAHYYFKQMVKIKEKMKQSENAVAIRKFSTRYDFEEKEKELSELSKEKTTLQNGLFTLIPVLGVIFLVSVLMFFLYKKYCKKAKLLEGEKSETLLKLDELKNIVIKNHITLKNKRKIYISDLIYIKADDHYLQIFTSDDKSNLVRGGLGKIQEELPPNFVRCHRSYIVNSNFIKHVNNDQIVLMNKVVVPLSRSYKSKF